MQFQKSSPSFPKPSLLTQNFKTNASSVRSIDKYLQAASQEHYPFEKDQNILSNSTPLAPISRPILSKTIARTVSNQFTQQQSKPSPKPLSKFNSLCETTGQDQFQTILRLKKESEQQKQIIVLQQQLIKKLLLKVEAPTKVNSIDMQQKEQQETINYGEVMNNLDKIVKVRTLLQSSLDCL